MIYVNPRIYTVPPEEGVRTPAEDDVYSLLTALDIPFSRMDHDPMARIDDCAPVEAALNITISKNLFLHNSRHEHYLLVMPGRKRFKSGDVSRKIGSTRLSFAPPEEMETLLQTKPGSASVLGLMYDREYQVKLLVDGDILKDEYFGCHPCVNTSSLKIKTDDIFTTFLEFTGHETKVLEF